MNKPFDASASVSAPLGETFHTRDLAGWGAKSLDVPEDRIGVALYDDGSRRTFQPGRQRVLSLAERLRGLGAGLRVGTVPASRFNAWLRAWNLMSGDDELLDASLFCIVEASDPTRFFEAIVWPAGRIVAADLDLSGDTSAEILDVFTRRYAAEDLIQGLPTAHLTPELVQLLNPALGSIGLRLVDLQLLYFRLAADRLLVAEKARELQARLQNVELESQMDEIEKRAQLADFLHQFEPELVEMGGLRFSEEVNADQAIATPKGAPRSSSWVEMIRMWLNVETQKLPAFWRLGALTKKRLEPTAAQNMAKAHPPRTWWVRRAVWIFFLILGGFVLSRFVNNFADMLGLIRPWELNGIVWLFVFGGVLESIKKLYETNELMSEAALNPPDMISLYDLAKDDRQQIDQIVRSQCSDDLEHIRIITNEMRGGIYRMGNEDQALKMRELEGRISRAVERIGRKDVNQAAYLSETQINQAAWELLLAEDEELLARSAALCDDANTIQQAFLNGQFKPEMLNRLESGLENFVHLFERRGRAFRATSQVQKQFRDPKFRNE